MPDDAPLVVAVDDGYASYDQEEGLLAGVGARFALRPVRGSAAAAVQAVRDASIVLVRESPLPRAAIEAMVRGKAVIRYGIGVDNIDQQAARERRIMVANVPDYGTDEVGTQGVALLLAVVRRLRLHDREVREGRWSTGVLAADAPAARAHAGLRRLRPHRAHDPSDKLAGFGFGRVLAHDPLAELPAGVTAARHRRHLPRRPT